MRTVPLDQARLGLVFNSVEKKTVYGGAPDEQARSSAGVPMWYVSLILASGETIRVSMPAASAPELPRFQPVVLTDLVAGCTDRGNFWFAATGIAAAQSK